MVSNHLALFRDVAVAYLVHAVREFDKLSRTSNRTEAYIDHTENKCPTNHCRLGDVRDRANLAWTITDTKQRKLLPIIENYLNNREQTMQATLTSRRDHNFRVDNRKENQLYLQQ